MRQTCAALMGAVTHQILASAPQDMQDTIAVSMCALESTRMRARLVPHKGNVWRRTHAYVILATQDMSASTAFASMSTQTKQPYVHRMGIAQHQTFVSARWNMAVQTANIADVSGFFPTNPKYAMLMGHVRGSMLALAHRGMPALLAS